MYVPRATKRDKNTNEIKSVLPPVILSPAIPYEPNNDAISPKIKRVMAIRILTSKNMFPKVFQALNVPKIF